MKIRALLTCAALIAGMSAPAFASCDVHKSDEDKQAKCAEKCDDAYLSRKMNYGAQEVGMMDKIKEEKKACDAACGCAENSKF